MLKHKSKTCFHFQGIHKRVQVFVSTVYSRKQVKHILT
jgi:hypothetical protein